MEGPEPALAEATGNPCSCQIALPQPAGHSLGNRAQGERAFLSARPPLEVCGTPAPTRTPGEVLGGEDKASRCHRRGESGKQSQIGPEVSRTGRGRALSPGRVCGKDRSRAICQRGENECGGEPQAAGVTQGEEYSGLGSGLEIFSPLPSPLDCPKISVQRGCFSQSSTKSEAHMKPTGFWLLGPSSSQAPGFLKGKPSTHSRPGLFKRLCL